MIQLEEMLEASTSFVRDGLAVVDLDGRYLYWSSCFCCFTEAKFGNTKRKERGKHDEYDAVE
jgi:hypothetical protein